MFSSCLREETAQHLIHQSAVRLSFNTRHQRLHDASFILSSRSFNLQLGKHLRDDLADFFLIHQLRNKFTVYLNAQFRFLDNLRTVGRRGVHRFLRLLDFAENDRVLLFFS